MSKKLAALQKKAAGIQAQIQQAELAQKNKSRTERISIKLLQKYPDLYLCDPAVLEKSLDTSLAAIASSLKNKQS